MKPYYHKNPLNNNQIKLVEKFNRLHKEVLFYYQISNDMMHSGEFLWEEPDFAIPILNLKKTDYKGDYINLRTFPEQINYLQIRYPFYVPFYIFSFGLVNQLSPVSSWSFSLPSPYSMKAVINNINENLKFMREINNILYNKYK